jgi:hypothetical protein
MNQESLEKRVSALEKQVSALTANGHANPTKDWRRTRGAFSGDDFMKQVFEEGRKIRATEKRASTSRKKKTR